jgi:hypothetical protein
MPCVTSRGGGAALGISHVRHHRRDRHYRARRQ